MKKRTLHYWFTYSVCFCVLFAAVFGILFAAGRSFVWTTDAKPQYLVYLEYMGRAMREWFVRLLHGDPSWKMFDFTIGMGEDVRSIFRMHLTDFLSVLCPSEYTEILYHFLMVLRFYLAGLAFSAYCFTHRFAQRNILTGSMIYVFCGYVMYFGSRHPVFASPMILMPLLMIGMDRLVEKKRGWIFLYSLAVTVSLMTSYYFLYMNTIALGVYALLRYAALYGGKRGKLAEFGGMMWRIVSGYLLGCGMAMMFFLPTVTRLFDSARVGSGSEGTMRLWSYSSARVIPLFLKLTAPTGDAGKTTYLIFAVIVIPVLVVLFCRRWREYWQLKVALLLCALFLIFPAGGYLMTGFTALNNRWSYLFSLTLAIASAAVMDDLREMTRAQKLALAAVTVVYLAVTWIYAKGKMNIRSAAAMAELVACVLVLFAIQRKKDMTVERFRNVTLAIVCVSVSIHGICTFCPFWSDMARTYFRWNGALASMRESGFRLAADLPAEDGDRVDSDLVYDNNENTPIYLQYAGTSFYNSVVNGLLVRYHAQMESSGISAVHRIYSLDARTAMEALAHVRYFLTKRGEEACVPYGFTLREEYSDEEYAVYENEYPLAFGYVYDTWLSQEEADSLGAAQQQETMLETVIADELPEGISMPKGSAAQGIVTDDVKIVSVDPEIEAEEGVYRVQKKNAGITLTCMRKAGYETYLRLEGLKRNANRVVVWVETEGIQKRVIVRGTNKTYSLGREDYLVNLGRAQKDGEQTIRLRFENTGKYQLRQAQLVQIPMDGYEEKIRMRNAEALEQVEFGLNTVQGTATVSGDRIMVFPILYSSGWKAYVDGEPVECFKANLTYTGIALTEGTHEIRLSYTTPGLLPGAWITAVSLCIYIGLWMRYRRREKKIQEAAGCGIR